MKNNKNTLILLALIGLTAGLYIIRERSKTPSPVVAPGIPAILHNQREISPPKKVEEPYWEIITNREIRNTWEDSFLGEIYNFIDSFMEINRLNWFLLMEPQMAPPEIQGEREILLTKLRLMARNTFSRFSESFLSRLEDSERRFENQIEVDLTTLNLEELIFLREDIRALRGRSRGVYNNWTGFSPSFNMRHPEVINRCKGILYSVAMDLSLGAEVVSIIEKDWVHDPGGSHLEELNNRTWELLEVWAKKHNPRMIAYWETDQSPFNYNFSDRDWVPRFHQREALIIHAIEEVGLDASVVHDLAKLDNHIEDLALEIKRQEIIKRGFPQLTKNWPSRSVDINLYLRHLVSLHTRRDAVVKYAEKEMELDPIMVRNRIGDSLVIEELFQAVNTLFLESINVSGLDVSSHHLRRDLKRKLRADNNIEQETNKMVYSLVAEEFNLPEIDDFPTTQWKGWLAWVLREKHRDLMESYIRERKGESAPEYLEYLNILSHSNIHRREEALEKLMGFALWDKIYKEEGDLQNRLYRNHVNALLSRERQLTPYLNNCRKPYYIILSLNYNPQNIFAIYEERIREKYDMYRPNLPGGTRISQYQVLTYSSSHSSSPNRLIQSILIEEFGKMRNVAKDRYENLDKRIKAYFDLVEEHIRRRRDEN